MVPNKKLENHRFNQPWHTFEGMRFPTSENERPFRLKMTVNERTMHAECKIRGKRQNCPTSPNESSPFVCRQARFHCARYLILSPRCLWFTDQIPSNSICMFPSSVFDTVYRLHARFIFFSNAIRFSQWNL